MGEIYIHATSRGGGGGDVLRGVAYKFALEGGGQN